MPICYYCGDEIEFRYVDGRPTPIHINGGWCSGLSGRTITASEPFRSKQSYLNPNARCPVCGENVYFYQSPLGGRVFFDDVGWPWPKHACTDNRLAQSADVKLLSMNAARPFINSRGEKIDVYVLNGISEEGCEINARFRIPEKELYLTIQVNIEYLESADITISDIETAPSFVVRISSSHRVIEFISARKGRIDSFTVPRMKPS